MYTSIFRGLVDYQELLLYLLQLVQALKFENITSSKSTDPTHDSSLAHFLITRSIQNPLLGNNFHWYLMVECEDRTSSSHKTFAKVAFQFMKTLSEQPDGTDRRGVFKRQAELVGKLQNISREVRSMRGDRGKKIERLKQSIRESGLETMEPLPLFLDAGVQMIGIDGGNPSQIYRANG
jgi:phosphatidylinositol 3-kinase